MTLHAKRAEIFEFFLTFAPPPPSEKWIDDPAVEACEIFEYSLSIYLEKMGHFALNEVTEQYKSKKYHIYLTHFYKWSDHRIKII